jgi:hypothetical protein
MVLSIFSKVLVYKPWYAEDLEPLNNQGYSDYVLLQNPPLERKPENHVKGLLPEYYRWMMEHSDRTSWKSVQTYKEIESGENKIWEIRKILRNAGKDSPASTKDRDFKNHLILHLAQEIEKHRMELNDRVHFLKKKGSVLEGAIEQINQENSPLNNLQSFNMEGMMDESHFTYIVESWLDLFGDSLSGTAPLLTLERSVFDLIRDALSEMRSGDTSARITLHESEFPDLSAYELNEILDRKNEEPLKGFIEGFLTQLQGLEKKAKTPFSIQTDLAEIEEAIDVSLGRLHLDLVYYELRGDEDHPKASSIVDALNKRAIIHIGQVSP